MLIFVINPTFVRSPAFESFLSRKSLEVPEFAKPALTINFAGMIFRCIPRSFVRVKDFGVVALQADKIRRGLRPGLKATSCNIETSTSLPSKVVLTVINGSTIFTTRKPSGDLKSPAFIENCLSTSDPYYLHYSRLGKYRPTLEFSGIAFSMRLEMLEKPTGAPWSQEAEA